MTQKNYTKEQRNKFFKELVGFEQSAYGDKHSENYRYLHAEYRYDCRSFISIHPKLEVAHPNIVCYNGVKYIYRLEACGIRYIGETSDPFERFVGHLIHQDGTSNEVIFTAMDNNRVPRMEIIDICDKEICRVIESFWISKLACINVQKSQKKLDQWLQNPYGRCVSAKIILGIKPDEFEEIKSRSEFEKEDFKVTYLPEWLVK